MPDATTTAYNRALVSYIDVLGFADLIGDSTANPVIVSKIAGLLSGMKEDLSVGVRFQADRKGRTVKNFDFFNFSDLIVRSTRVPNATELSEAVEFELFYLGAKQLDLALDGVLVRGGISVGDLFLSKDYSIVFGPALVRAYKLESQNAVYPRIVIDRDLISSMELNGDLARWGDYLRRGEDGAYFIDYLFDSCLSGIVLAGGPDFRLLKSHQEMIERKISDDIHKKHERIRQKYMWLALYHNATVKRLRDRVGERLHGTFEVPDNLLNF